jgi:hypothetical protein
MGILAFAVVIALQGGGIITYAIRTNETWHWADSSLVLARNAKP